MENKNLFQRILEGIGLAIKFTGLAVWVIMLFFYAEQTSGDGFAEWFSFELLFKVAKYTFLISLPIMIIIEVFSKEK